MHVTQSGGTKLHLCNGALFVENEFDILGHFWTYYIFETILITVSPDPAAKSLEDLRNKGLRWFPGFQVQMLCVAIRVVEQYHTSFTHQLDGCKNPRIPGTGGWPPVEGLYCPDSWAYIIIVYLGHILASYTGRGCYKNIKLDTE